MGGISTLIKRKNWEYFSILPKKKKYSKSLQEVTDACKVIQRFWREVMLKRVKARVKRIKAKFFCAVVFIALYHKMRMRREFEGVNRIENDPDEDKAEEKFEVF